MAEQEFDPNELLVFARILAALGVNPTGLLRRTLAAEQGLVAYATKSNIPLSPEGRAQIPEAGLADALREVPEALEAPTFIRQVMYFRFLAANPSESLWATLGAGGLGFIYRAAEPDSPSIPHSNQDGATVWNLTRETKERLDREAESNRFEDTPLGAPPRDEPPVPVPSLGPDLSAVLAILRKVAKALSNPPRRFALLDEAKLHQAIALNDRRGVLMAERMLTETESWEALAAELPRREGRKSSHADALRKFVTRMFRLNIEHPERFRMAYRKGGVSPGLLRVTDEADKRSAIGNLIQLLRRRAASLQG